MPSNYTLAKECQLFRRDVEGVLTLAAQLMLGSPSAPVPGTADSTAGHAPAASSSSSRRLSAGPVIGAVLTEANVRSLLLNTLVRVLVPAPRHAALLRENKYVQLANESAKKNQQEQQQQQQQQQGNSLSAGKAQGPASLNGGEQQQQQQQQYRVGRVVGVVPKPGAKPNTATEASQRWLLAVFVGECVEPFTLAALSDDAFTEVEHRVFVQSALSTNREDGSRRANVLPSQQPALLSAEMAATVQQNIKEIRRVLDVAAAETAGDGSAADALQAAVLQRASGVKRPRDSEEDGLGGNGKREGGDADPLGGSSLGAYLGTGAASQAARLARLTEDVAARGQQLQQLRQLLQQKDQEVKSALQQQQQREAQHRGEVDVWRAKAEEQSQAQARAAKEAAEALEQRDGLLEEANTKLRRLAGMTTKYKQVVDCVAALLKKGGGSGEGTGKPMGPDEILAALQHKSIV